MKTVITEPLEPKTDTQGNRVCAWEGCVTRLSRYNDHIVCRVHSAEYAVNYLPIHEDKNS